jgi:hypothetical protein
VEHSKLRRAGLRLEKKAYEFIVHPQIAEGEAVFYFKDCGISLQILQTP